MVFDFIKKKIKGKEEDGGTGSYHKSQPTESLLEKPDQASSAVPKTSQKTEISLEELEGFLSEKLQYKNVENVQQAAVLVDNVESYKKSLLGIISEFDSDDLEIDEVDKRLQSIIKRGKESVGTTIKKECNRSLTRPQSKNDVERVNDELGQSLKKIGDILGLNSRFMNNFASKYSKRIKAEMVNLNESKEQLQKLVDKQSWMSSTEQKITGLKDQYFEDEKRISEIQDELAKEIDSRIPQIQSSLSGLREEIEEKTQSEEMQNYAKKEKELESIKKEKEKLAKEIEVQFSSISRPLNKYSYVTAMDKSSKKILSGLIDRPFHSLSKDTKDTVMEILDSVSQAVKRNSVSVKDVDKSISQIAELKEKISGFIEKKEKLLEQESNIRGELENHKITEEINEKKKTLENSLQEEENLEKRREKLERELENSKNDRRQCLVQIKNLLSNLVDQEVELKELSSTDRADNSNNNENIIGDANNNSSTSQHHAKDS